MTSYTTYIPGEVDLPEIFQSPVIWKQFQERWAACSDRLSAILFGVDTMNKMIDVSVEFELTDEQTAEVSRAVRDIALGYLYTGDLAANLQQKLGVDEAVAVAIMKRIAELIAPCADEVKKTQLTHFRNRIEQISSAPKTPEQPPSNIINLREQK